MNVLNERLFSSYMSGSETAFEMSKRLQMSFRQLLKALYKGQLIRADKLAV